MSNHVLEVGPDGEGFTVECLAGNGCIGWIECREPHTVDGLDAADGPYDCDDDAPWCGDSHCGDGCDPSAVETFSQPTEGERAAVSGRLTDYGFEWGPVTVTRIAELPDGAVMFEVRTPHRTMQVYASPGDRSLRVFSGGFDIPMQGRAR